MGRWESGWIRESRFSGSESRPAVVAGLEFESIRLLVVAAIALFR